MPNKAIEKMFLDAYQMHSDAIFRFVSFKIDNREKALDITQDTFMKTWMHISKNGEIQNIRAFLYKVAGNLVIDEYRRRGRKDYGTDSLEDLAENGFEPSNSTDEIESMINKIDGEKVLKMTAELPPMYANILFLKYTEELSIQEIADNLGVSQNVVSVRLNRATNKLKELMERELSKYNQ
jgi:RNA polymerase sigma-70 factor (ECF subfamily)